MLFGTSKAHLDLRKIISEENQLEAVISLPSGVFKPYAGVSTAILIFTKGGKTDHVWFYDLEDDGFSLDDKRDKLYKDDFAGDLPDCLDMWKKRNESKENDRIKSFMVPFEEIKKNKYDFSINRYKEIKYEEEEYEDPIEIMKKVEEINLTIGEELISLKND